MSLLLLASSAFAGPSIGLGTSVAIGPEVQVQAGGPTLRGSLDALDLELHVDDRWFVVPRLGRFLAGVAGLEILDLEVDVLYRLAAARDGWQPLVAVGAGPRFTTGASARVVGLRALARIGTTWTSADGPARWQLFAEPHVIGEAGTRVSALSVGVRGGFAVVWTL